jgi:hypothetical protein
MRHSYRQAEEKGDDGRYKHNYHELHTFRRVQIIHIRYSPAILRPDGNCMTFEYESGDDHFASHSAIERTFLGRRVGDQVCS